MMKKYILDIIRIVFFLSLSVFLFVFCKKDSEDDEVPSGNNYHFTVEYAEQGPGRYGWVILHDLSGSSVIKYMKYTGNEILDFGEVSEVKVTVTRIDVDTLITPQGNKRWNIQITTDLAAPAGQWRLLGNYGSSTLYGTAEITANYPPDDYEKALLFGANFTKMVNNVPPDQIQYSRNLYGSPENTSFSIYCAVFKDTSGYCNWLLDEEMYMNQADYYEFDLNQILTYKNINTNLPVTNININGFWNNRDSRIPIYFDRNSEYTPDPYKHGYFYPENLPVSEVQISVSDYNDDYSLGYSKYFSAFDDLPENLSIPEQLVDGYYNESEDHITDISVPSTADRISGFWFHSSNNNNIFTNVLWNVNASVNANLLFKPALPQQIIDEIGNSIKHLEIGSIGMVDFDDATNYSDIVRQHYIENMPNHFTCTESYSYSKRLGNGNDKGKMGYLRDYWIRSQANK